MAVIESSEYAFSVEEVGAGGTTAEFLLPYLSRLSIDTNNRASQRVLINTADGEPTAVDPDQQLRATFAAIIDTLQDSPDAHTDSIDWEHASHRLLRTAQPIMEQEPSNKIETSNYAPPLAVRYYQTANWCVNDFCRWSTH